MKQKSKYFLDIIMTAEKSKFGTKSNKVPVDSNKD